MGPRGVVWMGLVTMFWVSTAALILMAIGAAQHGSDTPSGVGYSMLTAWVTMAVCLAGLHRGSREG